MTTVSAWAKPGAWALDSEENEAIEAMKQQNHIEINQFDFEQQQQPLTDFPSLATAATAKPKKKKSQSISLAEFTTGKQVTHGAAKTQPKGLTSDELLVLPTGPRERTAEELDRSRLGGGFNNYGGSGSRRGSGDDSSSSRWGASRVSDEPRRNGGFNRDSAPSRADEIDDWGAGKKSAPMGERRERVGGFFDNQSRADDSESWVTNKSFVPSEGRRFEGFSKERKGGFDMFQKEVSIGGGDSDSWGKKKEEGSGRPRLVLQPRTRPVSNGDQQTTSPQHQPLPLPLPQPGSAKSKGSNPFGAARPREEVLAEKGQDWKKIDEQLESMKVKEVGSADGPSFGKKSFGSGRSLPEDRTERNWRKTGESADGSPRSADEAADDGVADN